MRIASVEAIPVSIPVKPELAITSAAGEHRLSRYVLVVIRAEGGLSGFGEANVVPVWSGESQEGALAAIREILAPVVTGRDVSEVAALSDAMDRVLVGNPFTKAAVEMALLDLVGKLLHAPAHVLLGGARRPPRIPLKFSIGAFPPPAAARVAESALAMGLRAVKVKVGTNPAEDLERIQAVRSAVGPQIRIGADANGGWSEHEAAAALPELERLGVNVLEEPLRRGDFRGCARLRARTAIPILLDESVFTPQELLEAIRADACDMVSLYPGKNGGLRRSLAMAETAAAAGLECVIGSNLEWEIGSAAMLQLAVAIPNLAGRVDHDIIGPLYHVQGVGAAPIVFEDGCALLPEGPGLGLEPDLERISRLRAS
jgi:muconate cycloisomerase